MDTGKSKKQGEKTYPERGEQKENKGKREVGREREEMAGPPLPNFIIA